MGPETVAMEKRRLDDSSVLTGAKKRKLEDTEIKSDNSEKKVDPSELASAFALASLASLSPGAGNSQRTQSTQPIKEKKIEEQRPTVQEDVSWEEARSPKATQAPNSPDQRSPGSPGSSPKRDEEPASPEASRHVTFAPSTKGQQELGTPNAMPTPKKNRDAHMSPSHRIALPNHRQGVFVPRPRGNHMPYHGMNGGGVFRTPPPMPHHRPPHMPHAVHSPYHRQPWVHPAHAAAAAAAATGRMYPPQRLLQPQLLHPDNQWICDYCNVASFNTYEEACVHEEACKIRCAGNTPRQTAPGLQQNSSLASRSGSGDEESTAVLASGSSDTWHTGSMSLAMEESDREWLSELNCFIRSHCIEVFSATEEDVARSSKRGRITLNQVGLRCKCCAQQPIKDKAVAAVSFPTTIGGIYESVKRWQRVHLEVCESVTPETRDKLAQLANTNVWVPTTRQYWADSAKAMGLVDTSEGIRFGVNPREVTPSEAGVKAPMSRNAMDASHGPMRMGPQHHPSHGYQGPREASAAGDDHHSTLTRSDDAQSPTNNDSTESAEYIVVPEDMDLIPPYVYFLMRQVEPCRFTEADRFVARSKGPVGYPGFQCRHCNGHAGLGKYFPVSAKSLSTNSTSQNIHAHLLKCRKCPDAVKDRLVQLKIEKGRSPRLEPGWRKIFFDKVWGRLHDGSD